MAQYKVGIPEVHYSYRIVEADSIEEAIQLSMGEAEIEEIEYSHTLEDTSEFTVKDVSTNQIYRMNDDGVWVPREF